MALKIYTAHYRYKGQDRLDISVKTGNQVFAPTSDMVVSHKKKMISNKSFTRKYLNLLTNSFEFHRGEWEVLLGKEEVTIVCSENPDDDFCVCRVFAELVTGFCGAVYMGERPKRRTLTRILKIHNK